MTARRLSSRRPSRRGGGRLALALVAMALQAFSPLAARAQPTTTAALPDGRKLAFYCSGAGSPTVLLESGFGASGSAWSLVSSRIAPVTRVCAYDRAGSGASDPGPLPRDGEAIARDLDRGLRAAHIRGPFVLVGHSSGSLYIRLFAARRRREVAGLLFVDSSVEHQLDRVARLTGTQGNLDGVRGRPSRCLGLAQAHATGEAEWRDCLPPNPTAHDRDVALNPATWRTQLSELDTLFTTTSDQVDRVGGLLRNVPAIVLSAGRADTPLARPGDPALAQSNPLHRELTLRFTGARMRVVKSSHLIMIDRPEVVADAAIELVGRARRR